MPVSYTHLDVYKRQKFDIALLDPPYEKSLIQRSLPALTEKMKDTGVIICEHEPVSYTHLQYDTYRKRRYKQIG